MTRKLLDQAYKFQVNTPMEELKKETHHATYQIDVTEDGILQYMDGAAHPQKGFPDSDAVKACDVAKRLLIVMLRMRPMILPTIKNLDKLLRNYNDVSFKILKEYILAYQTPLADELYKTIWNYLIRIGITEKTAEQTAMIISCLFEYDNAYRFRLQDLFTAISQDEIVHSPYKTVVKVFRLSKERDHPDVHNKFKLLKPIVLLSLCIPKFRKAFIETFKESNFARLQLDEIDEYWVSQRIDYNFYGTPQPILRQRIKGKKLPKKMTLKQIQRKYGNK